MVRVDDEFVLYFGLLLSRCTSHIVDSPFEGLGRRLYGGDSDCRCYVSRATDGRIKLQQAGWTTTPTSPAVAATESRKHDFDFELKLRVWQFRDRAQYAQAPHAQILAVYLAASAPKNIFIHGIESRIGTDSHPSKSGYTAVHRSAYNIVRKQRVEDVSPLEHQLQLFETQDACRLTESRSYR